MDEDKKKDYRTVPESPGLGSGMAEQARQKFLGRRRKVEDALKDLMSGKDPNKKKDAE